jgi:hypothetical protein
MLFFYKNSYDIEGNAAVQDYTREDTTTMTSFTVQPTRAIDKPGRLGPRA